MITEIRMSEVEDYFLKRVNSFIGFVRRTDGKIERDVSPHETWTKPVKGEFYPQAEIISEDEFLFFINREIKLEVQEDM